MQCSAVWSFIFVCNVVNASVPVHTLGAEGPVPHAPIPPPPPLCRKYDARDTVNKMPVLVVLAELSAEVPIVLLVDNRVPILISIGTLEKARERRPCEDVIGEYENGTLVQGRAFNDDDDIRSSD